MRPPFDRSLGLGLGVLVALLVLSAALTHRNTQHLNEDTRRVAHTVEVSEALAEVHATAAEAESAQREYLLTGRTDLLAAYEAAAAALGGKVDRVQHLTADNPRQQARVPRLRETLAAELRKLARTAEVRRAQGLDAAVQTVRTGEGRRLMGEARAILADMLAEERSLLRERQAASARMYAVAVTNGLLTALLGLTAVGAVAWLGWRDLAARTDAAAALAQQRRVLHATLTSIGDAVAATDDGGRVTFLNHAAEALTGWPAAEAVGRPLGEVFRAVDEAARRPAEDIAARVVRESDRAGLADPTVVVARDGRETPVEASAAPIRDEGGSVAGVILVYRDVTERRRHARELERHAEELERRVDERTRELREANAALEALGYTVSHDLRAPLRNMQSLAQALVEDYADRLDDVGRDYTRRIDHAARRMDQLILDLLAYSRLSRVELPPSRADLAGAVAEARAAVADAERGGARVRVEGPLPAVLAHRPTLVQMAANLLANAVKFVAPGVPPDVRVRAEQRGPAVRLWVEDNGIGVAPEHRERIFRAFERLHGEETYPGTGIGLAIVRKGAERIGGRAGVESDGAGSRFWVELPAAEDVT